MSVLFLSSQPLTATINLVPDIIVLDTPPEGCRLLRTHGVGTIGNINLTVRNGS